MTYAEAVKRSLAQRNMKIRELSEAIGCSYEHCRKIIMGAPVVSQELNETLCSTLALDAAEMWRLARSEKAAARFGVELPKEYLDARSNAMLRLWAQLAGEERKMLLGVAEGLLLRQKRESRGPKPKNHPGTSP
jgi:hypothetical protein